MSKCLLVLLCGLGAEFFSFAHAAGCEVTVSVDQVGGIPGYGITSIQVNALVLTAVQKNGCFVVVPPGQAEYRLSLNFYPSGKKDSGLTNAKMSMTAKARLIHGEDTVAVGEGVAYTPSFFTLPRDGHFYEATLLAAFSEAIQGLGTPQQFSLVP